MVSQQSKISPLRKKIYDTVLLVGFLSSPVVCARYAISKLNVGWTVYALPVGFFGGLLGFIGGSILMTGMLTFVLYGSWRKNPQNLKKK